MFQGPAVGARYHGVLEHMQAVADSRQVSWVRAVQVFGLLDMQEQVEAALANMALTLESSSASNILADFTQLAAMIRQEVTLAPLRPNVLKGVSGHYCPGCGPVLGAGVHLAMPVGRHPHSLPGAVVMIVRLFGLSALHTYVSYAICALMLVSLEQARATLEEFEASITKDSVKHPPPDGTVHPLAAYTLSFLKRLFAYEATIDTLFSDEENEVPPAHPNPPATYTPHLAAPLLVLHCLMVVAPNGAMCSAAVLKLTALIPGRVPVHAAALGAQSS